MLRSGREQRQVLQIGRTLGGFGMPAPAGQHGPCTHLSPSEKAIASCSLLIDWIPLQPFVDTDVFACCTAKTPASAQQDWQPSPSQLSGCSSRGSYYLDYFVRSVSARHKSEQLVQGNKSKHHRHEVVFRASPGALISGYRTRSSVTVMTTPTTEEGSKGAAYSFSRPSCS